MAGTLSVQKIQGLASSATPTVVEVSSGHELHTNTLKGTTTAGSITVQGEGSATTNLQQGLAKAWVLFNGTGTIASTDSFNISGLTDNGTGNYTIVIDNNMNVSDGFSCVGSDEDRGVGETDPSGTGGVTCVRRNTSATAQDCAQISVTVHGDLA